MVTIPQTGELSPVAQTESPSVTLPEHTRTSRYSPGVSLANRYRPHQFHNEFGGALRQDSPQSFVARSVGKPSLDPLEGASTAPPRILGIGAEHPAQLQCETRVVAAPGRAPVHRARRGDLPRGSSPVVGSPNGSGASSTRQRSAEARRRQLPHTPPHATYLKARPK